MPKLLCILHRSPPAHGAAKVGDFIGSSEKLQEKFDCRFITIKSSDTISDIGKISFKKIYLVLELYIKVLWALLIFRPDKLYFTASIKGVALYRDVLISTLWKLYSKFTFLDIYYHYHTKGIDSFVSISRKNLQLTNFFLRDVNLVLLTPLLKNDFSKITTFKKVLFLPNGVENTYNNNEFESYISKKDFNNINILYLSNMIKAKGYFEVLKLAKICQDKNYHFHFAGGWQNESEKVEFFQYIKDNKLENMITFHGFINGEQKKILFENIQLLMFPTRFESFGLVITEALSYGVPVISTDEGSIPFILNNKCGTIINDSIQLEEALQHTLNLLVNLKTAKYCRERFLEKFTLEQFENNLINLFDDKYEESK